MYLRDFAPPQARRIIGNLLRLLAKRLRVTAEAKSKVRVRKLYSSGTEAIQECIDTGEGR